MLAIYMRSVLMPAHNLYAPIDRAALEQYKIFKSMGFYGVDGSHRGAAEFLKRSLHILQKPGSSLWLTPEGKFCDPRQLDEPIQPGLAHLAYSIQREPQGASPGSLSRRALAPVPLSRRALAPFPLSRRALAPVPLARRALAPVLFLNPPNPKYGLSQQPSNMCSGKNVHRNACAVSATRCKSNGMPTKCAAKTLGLNCLTPLCATHNDC